MRWPACNNQAVDVPGPVLLRPSAPLAAHVQFFGYWHNTQAMTHRSRALPRGAATVIIDLDGREQVDFYAADATSRLDVGAAFIAGAGTTSYVTQIAPSQTVLTIHFRPNAGTSGRRGVISLGAHAVP